MPVVRFIDTFVIVVKLDMLVPNVLSDTFVVRFVEIFIVVKLVRCKFVAHTISPIKIITITPKIKDFLIAIDPTDIYLK